MFVYLSKKIAIPNNFRLNCIAWNQKQGYIAVGGDDGLLKVICVDASSSDNSAGKTRNSNTSSNLSMNQTLDGHNGQVQVVIWNEDHSKLTSSDQNGVIIVWMLYKGSWYEEMINNRNKSVVKGMAWSSDGQKICIVYEDGAVIVGSVDGNRIWGKEIKNTSLCGVQWSPDCKSLLFGLKSGELHLYDNQGTFMTVVGSMNLSPGIGLAPVIVSMHWYDGKNGYVSHDFPTLAICYQSGKLQLMRDCTDDNSIFIETGITTVWCQWNSFGSILAVAGMTSLGSPTDPGGSNIDSRGSNVLHFYSPYGEKLKVLRIPGREVTCCSWEGGSLRVALSVDSHVYFANIRPSYKWTYFSKTVVFTNERMTKDGICIYFWNTNTNALCTKYVKSLVSIASCEEHCVLAAQNNSKIGTERYVLIVCNAIATPVDTKYIELEPLWVGMSSNTVIAASKNQFLVWNFRTPRSSSLNASRNQRRSRVYHVDDTPTGVTQIIQDLDKEGNVFETPVNKKTTMDAISCLAITDKILLVGRESGMVQRYSLPQVTLTNRYCTYM